MIVKIPTSVEEKKSKQKKFTSEEIKFLVGLASGIGLRQVGLLLVIPFISIYCLRLEGGTPALAGLALGIYGLVQALLQVPFGYISDRIGRKPVVLFGLFLFAAGYLLAGVAGNIYTFILARILQGSGAISAVIYAWIGDEIPASKRNRAMGVLGIIMGLSAVFSFVFGPLLYVKIGLKNLFFMTAFASFLAGLYILLFVRESRERHSTAKTETISWSQLKEKRLAAVYYGSFLSNFILISFFYLVPLLLAEITGESELWKIYVPGAVFGIIIMRLGLYFADRGREREVLLSAYLSSLLGVALIFFNSFVSILFATALMFAGYNILVTLLPSITTKIASSEIRGSATGGLNMMQFLGSFVGGSFIGAAYQAGLPFAVLLIALFILSGIFSLKFFPERNEE